MTKADDIKKQVEYYESLILRKISVFLHNKRKEKDVTVRELNKLTGISIGVISDLENHNSMPRVETLLRICEALDIPFDLLFENMKISKTDTRKGGSIVKIDKFNKLAQTLTELEEFEYTKEDIAEIISYVKYIDFKKQSK